MTELCEPNDWFTDARYGMFVHYGLFSLLERGEWVMNREQISGGDYMNLALRFTAANFDADAICDLAVRSGMRYIVFTTMHHEGFMLYESALSQFNSVNACGRDLTAEIVAAARKRGLKIGLYHSLNNWTARPDAVDALEGPDARARFIADTFARIRELVTRYNPVDTLWYDGWWPFDAAGWQAEEMNAMVRTIQPHILFNGRNGLPGDFATPEGHLSAPRPWRRWEACMTMNTSWGFHRGDNDWKTPAQVIALLATCAQGRGNLLLNVGPRGDGSLPEPSVKVLEQVGVWLQRHGEAIFDTDLFTFDLQERGAHRGDWCPHGPMTARGNSLYLLAMRWPGDALVLSGIQNRVSRVTKLGSETELAFIQDTNSVTVTGLPNEPPGEVCPVLRFECVGPPAVYLCGGMRVPSAPHPHYDPCPSDIAH